MQVIVGLKDGTAIDTKSTVEEIIEMMELKGGDK